MEEEAQMVVSGRPEPAAYLAQDSQQTIREGLEEFRGDIPKPFGGNDPSSPVEQLFQCHDICHVVFGLSTDLRDEVLADTWAILLSSQRITACLKEAGTIPLTVRGMKKKLAVV
ncbi:MAG: hypothetical protein MRJ66_09785 [Nitrospira sp.]|nr:hypothetical protein [Nitrospira sp.]